MIEPKNIEYTPSVEELLEYIENPLAEEFLSYLKETYEPIYSVEYSKDSLARGWNIKVRKAGRSLCVLYPRKKFFTILVVIGTKEKEETEKLLPTLSTKLNEIYKATKEGNGQRWLMIDLEEKDNLYLDILKLIQIRRQSSLKRKLQ